MQAVRLLTQKILAWLRVIQKPDFTVRFVSDHPERSNMQPGILYIVSTGGFQKWVYFLCPTSDKDVIQLSLQTNRRPSWQIAQDFLGRPTIHPSVRQMEGSYAHFWIKNGKVDWCVDTGNKPRFTNVSERLPF